MKVTGFNRLSIGAKNLAVDVDDVHAAEDAANRPHLEAACRAR